MQISQNLEEPLMRNLEAARAAYTLGNAEASRIAHSQPQDVAHEAHLESGGRIKSLVFGGCVRQPAVAMLLAHLRAASFSQHVRFVPFASLPVSSASLWQLGWHLDILCHHRGCRW